MKSETTSFKCCLRRNEDCSARLSNRCSGICTDVQTWHSMIARVTPLKINGTISYYTYIAC